MTEYKRIAYDLLRAFCIKVFFFFLFTEEESAKITDVLLAADLSGIEAVVVGHHGSKTSSCEEYLSEMAGGSAIISVGKNSYGLPSPEVLERLERFGYTVYRTDLNGNVELRIDG